MGRAREKIHGAGADGAIAQGGKAGHIPGQSGRVAGYIHNAAGCHRGGSLYHIGRQALPGRVHADHVGPQAPLPQLRRQPGGIAAQELHVLHAVAAGAVLRVPDSLRHDLAADDVPGPAGQHLGDGTRTAVQVHRQLPAGESGILQGLFVQTLGLVVVHLVKRRHRQPQLQSAEGIRQIVPAPEGPVPIP